MDAVRRDISLTEKLKKYADSDIYPYHMPGHKGNADTGSAFDKLHGMDITEIDGFDDLHHATGILKRAQEEAAEVFGADRTFYLVGGSTIGVLAAVSAALEQGSELLVARNCHKSVYHAAYLRGLKLHYILPKLDVEAQIFKPVTVEQVREALREYPNTGAVLITSPTYEGLVADVSKIAEAVHEKEIPLIVDEAHGAHFGFGSCLPLNSNAWADLVIQSLHKTTKALTQTALLHVNGNRVPPACVEKYLDIYMTSSPSYLLMASMEEAVADLRDNGERLYCDFIHKKEDFLQKTAGMEALWVYKSTAPEGSAKMCGVMDPCKILICSRAREFSGKNLYNALLQRYHLQMELCENNHVLAIMTPYDRLEGFDRLAAALNEIDGELVEKNRDKDCGFGLAGAGGSMIMTERVFPHLPRRAQTLAESWSEGRAISIAECAGRISAAFVYQYPPGIPLIVPGEVWDERLITEVREKVAIGYELLGIAEKCGTIEVMVTGN